MVELVSLDPPYETFGPLFNFRSFVFKAFPFVLFAAFVVNQRREMGDGEIQMVGINSIIHLLIRANQFSSA